MTVVVPAAADGRQIREFRNRGFVALQGLLPAGQLKQARIAAERAVTAPIGTSCERPNNSLIPLRWGDDLVDLVLGAYRRIALAIGARDLRWISGYVSIKESHSPPLWWHQDWWAWDYPVSFWRESPQVAVMCYLSDTTIETGALRVLPSSHMASVPLHRVLPEAHSDESMALDPQHPAMTDHPQQITLELRAGDAVVTDYRLLHGTHANTGDHRRDCVLLSFTPHWNELPAEVRGHLISHPALPRADGPRPRWTLGSLLPSFDGPRQDLILNRNAPSVFATSDDNPI